MENLIFARHETFHPRYGWLKKGFDKASTDKAIFLKDDASVVFGVGKNMVKAIRYWCHAYKVLNTFPQKRNESEKFAPLVFGERLLSDTGWDPYLEDLASLWLLHWKLLQAPCYATTWHFVFNKFYKNVFTVEELVNSLKEYIYSNHPSLKVSDSSIVKDVNCLLRMYVEQTNSKILKEDSIDSPFTELNLIKNYGDSKHFTLNVGSKPGLVPEIIVATCLEYASIVEGKAKTFSIQRLLYEDGSPGLTFKLTENVLIESIEEVARSFPDISFSGTAGLIQFSYAQEPILLAEQILNLYYKNRRN